MTPTPLYAVPEPRWEHRVMLACSVCLEWVGLGTEPGTNAPGWSPQRVQARWPSAAGWGLLTGDPVSDVPFSSEPCGCCGGLEAGERHELIAMRSVSR